MSRSVVIEYRTVVPGTVYTPAHMPGERFVIPSAALAKMHHPEAVVIGYEDGGAYDSRTDESMIDMRKAAKEEREAAQAASEKAAAEEAARQKAEKEAADAAAKAAKAAENAQDGRKPA